MWTSSDFETYPKHFDFSSSDQGQPTYTALKVGETEIANLIEHLDGEIDEDQSFQLILCEHCGFHQCQMGNWVSLRKHDHFVFVMPAFDRWREGFESGEYQPPHFLNEKGALWFSEKTFELFKRLVPAIDKLQSINNLSSQELKELFLWDAPGRIFGRFPEFKKIEAANFLAASALEIDSVLEIINVKLRVLTQNRNFKLSPVTPDDQVITLILDDQQLTEWSSLCENDGEYSLMLGELFKISFF